MAPRPSRLTAISHTPYSAAMHNELDALEQKLGQFLELCQRLRIENQELRDRNAALEAERQRLADKVEEARSRLEALIAKLPET